MEQQQRIQTPCPMGNRADTSMTTAFVMQSKFSSQPANIQTTAVRIAELFSLLPDYVYCSMTTYVARDASQKAFSPLFAFMYLEMLHETAPKALPERCEDRKENSHA